MATPCEPMLESFVQVDDHDDSGLDGNAKKCDVADPNGNAEVVAEHPLKEKPAGHRIKRRKDQNGSFRQRS